MNGAKNIQVLSFSEPLIIGYMSVNVSREYNQDLSQLKYLNGIPNGTVFMDLNHKISEAVKRTTDDNVEKISLLLKFLKFNIHRVKCHLTKLTFISYRRTLISVMYNTFNRDHVQIMACLFNGSIYLCSLETPEELQRRKSRSKQEQKFCAWGYKFEQYLLSDCPYNPPSIQNPVIENEEFSMYYYTKLGQNTLLYGAQIDGMFVCNSKVTSPPDTKDYCTNVNYLRKNDYIELKTNREIHNQRQDQNFRKYKLFRCWCQCYLANLKGLLVGFRDDIGIITRLQWFDTEDIPAYCKREWQPQRAIDFLNYFLTFVKTTFRNKFGNSLTNSTGPLSLIFDLHGTNISVFECDDKIEPILPDWFIEAMTNKENK